MYVFEVGHVLFSFTNKKAQMINVNSLFIIHKWSPPPRFCGALHILPSINKHKIFLTFELNFENWTPMDLSARVECHDCRQKSATLTPLPHDALLTLIIHQQGGIRIPYTNGNLPYNSDDELLKHKTRHQENLRGYNFSIGNNVTTQWQKKNNV